MSVRNLEEVSGILIRPSKMIKIGDVGEGIKVSMFSAGGNSVNKDIKAKNWGV